MAKRSKRISGVRATSASQNIEFNPDYSHVKKDLTRIATLAGFFIVALVVLSFFIK